MNLEISYQSYCQRHLSPLLSTFVSIDHLHVEANFILKAWESFQLIVRIMNNRKVKSSKLGQLMRIFLLLLLLLLFIYLFIYIYILDDMMDVALGCNTYIYTNWKINM